MLDLLKAVIYGIIEGITEWLPVSSTGHLIIAEALIPFDNTSEGFFDMFDVVIQLGAILAVVVLFFWKIWPFAFRKSERERLGQTHVFKKDIWLMWAKIIVACLPAAVVGLLFDDKCEELFYNPPSVAVALIVFGILFIVIETINKGKTPRINSVAEITWVTAFLIGVFQVLAAVFPGTSRSGATIIGALLIGVSRTAAAEFTFFLAIPVMLGASLLKVVKFLADGAGFAGMEVAVLSIGTVVSFVVSFYALKALMNYVKKHDFKIFGYYRIALGVIVIVLALCKVL